MTATVPLANPVPGTAAATAPPVEPPSRTFQVWIAQTWTRRGWAAWALWPLSQLFGLVVRLRRLLYRLGAFKTHKVNAPVLLVGNAVVGGAGKTPVVLMLVAHLRTRGLRVGVVSRGYGRTTADCREVQKSSLPLDVGDEPLLIKQQSNVPVFVGLQRHLAAAALLEKYPKTQLIIGDDGLQHLALQRDLEICVFDQRGHGNGFMLPAGPLREIWPRRSLFFKPWPDVPHFVLHNGSEPAGSRSYLVSRKLAPYAQSKDGIRFAFPDLAGKPVIALAAIAQPQRFFDMLQEAGLGLQSKIALPDHFDFSGWQAPPHGADANGALLLCTQKDAVKLWLSYPQVLAVPLVLTPEPDLMLELDLAINSLLRPA